MLKYSVGLDISVKEIHACISVIDNAQKVTVKSTRTIENNKSGFANLVEWIGKNWKKKELPLVTSMEATGAYYENCAIYLNKQGYRVSVVLPNIAKKYMQASGLKSKNDKIDAQGLSKMGAEKCLDPWEPLTEYAYQLRCLTRQYQDLSEQKTRVSNQLHADEYGMYKNEIVMGQLKATILSIGEQQKSLQEAIEAQIALDSEVSRKVENICKIKGVGILTVAVILAETNLFASFKNVPQVVSYAGYDVIENSSGDHKGDTRISKSGNSRIRRILFMPAFSVVSSQEKIFVDLYKRTLCKHNIKMKSYVAVQKKILILIFGLWKKGVAFDKDFKQHTKEKELVPSLGMRAERDGKEIAPIKD